MTLPPTVLRLLNGDFSRSSAPVGAPSPSPAPAPAVVVVAVGPTGWLPGLSGEPGGAVVWIQDGVVASPSIPLSVPDASPGGAGDGGTAPTPAPSDPSQATGDQDELAATQLYMEKVKEDPHAVPCFGGLFCIEIGQPY